MANVFAGVDVGGTRIKAGLADASGRLLSSDVFETRCCQDTESFLETVAGQIKTQAKAAASTVAAAGLGCPGRIDFASGRVVWLKEKLEFLEGVPLAAMLSEGLGCPVVCDNDVNAILAGEMRFGAGRGCREVLGMTVGTGIGGAVVFGGRMVRSQLGYGPLRLYVTRSLGSPARLWKHRNRRGARLAHRNLASVARRTPGGRDLASH